MYMYKHVYEDLDTHIACIVHVHVYVHCIYTLMYTPEIIFLEGVQLWVISNREQQSSQWTQQSKDIPAREMGGSECANMQRKDTHACTSVRKA